VCPFLTFPFAYFSFTAVMIMQILSLFFRSHDAEWYDPHGYEILDDTGTSALVAADESGLVISLTTTVNLSVILFPLRLLRTQQDWNQPIYLSIIRAQVLGFSNHGPRKRNRPQRRHGRLFRRGKDERFRLSPYTFELQYALLLLFPASSIWLVADRFDLNTLSRRQQASSLLDDALLHRRPQWRLPVRWFLRWFVILYFHVFILLPPPLVPIRLASIESKLIFASSILLALCLQAALESSPPTP
jgi:hypothetical protein